MFKLKSKLLTLALTVTCASLSQAQSNQDLIDVLIQKGILSNDEAKAIQADAKKAASQNVTTVSAKLFVDVSDVTAKNGAGVQVDPSGFGVDVKRFYLGVAHQFDDRWSASINTDSAYSSSTGTTSTYIKTAYVQAKFSPECIVQVGSANQPWIPFVEDIYGFRYLENTLIDRLKVGNSADWGIHVLGKSGIVTYSLAAVEGGGYKNPTRSKSVDLEGRVSIEPVKGFTLAVGGYDGKLGKDSNAAPAKQTASRFDAMAAYTNDKFNVGVEYFTEDNWGLTTATTPDRGDGYSAWAQYHLDPVWSVFGRYDNDKTSKDLNPAMQDNYFNMGLECAAIKGVKISLVYKKDKIDHPTSAATVADYQEIGLFSEIKF